MFDNCIGGVSVTKPTVMECPLLSIPIVRFKFDLNHLGHNCHIEIEYWHVGCSKTLPPEPERGRDISKSTKSKCMKYPVDFGNVGIYKYIVIPLIA
ncbi:hypothetical protein QTP88_023473 [Uroleucon formosanum]